MTRSEEVVRISVLTRFIFQLRHSPGEHHRVDEERGLARRRYGRVRRPGGKSLKTFFFVADGRVFHF